MIPNERLIALRAKLDRETVLALIQHVGYVIGRNGMFKLRPEERTASSSVGKRGQISDFGSGWSGDILTLLQDYQGLSFPQAFEYVAACLEGSK